MLRGRVVITVAMVGFVLALTGCAKAPQQAIDQAQSALKGAEQAQAPAYAPDAWEEAQQSMNDAQAELEAQKAKFAPLRSYKKAGELLAAAQKQAAQAQEAAVAGKQQAQAEAEQAMGAAQSGLDRANQLLDSLSKCRHRPKGFASDLELLRGNVAGLTQQLSEVQSVMAKESYLEAKSLAAELQGQVDSVVKDLERAKAKIGC